MNINKQNILWMLLGAAITIVLGLTLFHPKAQAHYHCYGDCVTGPTGISGPTGSSGETGPSGSTGTTGGCVEACVTPEVMVEVTQAPQGGPGDNLSDGRTDGQHQGPDGLGCAAHECKALDTTTTQLASTGDFEEKLKTGLLYAMLFIAGCIVGDQTNKRIKK